MATKHISLNAFPRPHNSNFHTLHHVIGYSLFLNLNEHPSIQFPSYLFHIYAMFLLLLTPSFKFFFFFFGKNQKKGMKENFHTLIWILELKEIGSV